jgi:hypothetical protein
MQKLVHSASGSSACASSIVIIFSHCSPELSLDDRRRYVRYQLESAKFWAFSCMTLRHQPQHNVCNIGLRTIATGQGCEYLLCGGVLYNTISLSMLHQKSTHRHRHLTFQSQAPDILAQPPGSYNRLALVIEGRRSPLQLHFPSSRPQTLQPSLPTTQLPSTTTDLRCRPSAPPWTPSYLLDIL